MNIYHLLTSMYDSPLMDRGCIGSSLVELANRTLCSVPLCINEMADKTRMILGAFIYLGLGKKCFCKPV